MKTKGGGIQEKIGLIGVGNMGSAILSGLLEKGKAQPRQIYVHDILKEKAAQFAAEHKINEPVPFLAGLVRRVEVVLLAIKPQDLKEVGSGLKLYLTHKHTLISILAGTPIARIKEVAGEKASIVRAMPNLGAKVGRAITALGGSSKKSLKIAEGIFSACGETIILEDEPYFDLVTAVSGSGPAYFFLMMEMLADFAETKGLSKKDAQTLAVQTAVGAGLLAESSSISPAEFRKMVTSKGGTTEAALRVLEERKFGEIFHQALEAAFQRGRELSRGN